MKKFIVETLFSYGWENCWTEEVDGVENPLTFNTRAEAQAEIDDHLECCNEAVFRGDMAFGYPESDFRIVEVDK